MKYIPIVLLLFVAFNTRSQVTYHQSETAVTAIKSTVILRDLPDALYIGQDEPVSSHGRGIDRIKADLDHRRAAFIRSGNPRHGQVQKAGDELPSADTGFTASNPSGIPNDNNMAISNDGIIVSVANSRIGIYDTNGTQLSAKRLNAFITFLTNFDSPFDPHVVYDMEEDKFVFTCLEGSSSNDSRLIVGFSETNDPEGTWHFYELPGNVHGDNTWSDYPFIGLSTEEVFIPVLLWKDGESGWDSEATNEIIWQINKQDGYKGDSLRYHYFDSVTVNGRQVWNTRPIQGGNHLYGPNMYLLANRGIDLQNDSIFLFEITNSLASGQAQLNTTIIKSSQAYGIPPSAPQPGSSKLLRTNYADIHHGFYQNGRIQFVANSINTGTMSPGIYHGVISGIGNNPTATGHIIARDTLDLNYPSIAYAGSNGADHSALINCLHVSSTTPAGTSVFYTDGQGNYSDLVRVVSGDGAIQLISDTLERWGDYTGMQTRYNQPGTAWLAGSHSRSTGSLTGTWVTRVRSNSVVLGTQNKPLVSDGFSLFPNPSGAYFNAQITLTAPNRLQFELRDMQGRLIRSFGHRDLKSGTYTLEFETGALPDGIYLFSAYGQDGTVVLKEKVVHQSE